MCQVRIAGCSLKPLKILKTTFFIFGVFKVIHMFLCKSIKISIRSHTKLTSGWLSPGMAKRGQDGDSYQAEVL